jgi:hypothetical protein
MRLTFCLLILLTLSSLFAGTIAQDYDVTVPSLTRSGDQVRIQLDNSVLITRPGKPAIPAVPVRLLLNPGEKAVGVTIHFGEPVELDGTYALPPMQEPVPTSQTSLIRATPADRTVYDSDAAYPAFDYSGLTTQYYCGHSIAIVNVYPVKYHPASGRVEYYPNFSVEITTANDDDAQLSLTRYLRSDELTVRNLRQYVDNPRNASSYPSTRNRDDGPRMLIITSSSFVTDLAGFVTLKTRQGMNPIVTTTQTIYASTTGVDNQDKIRNYIISCYQTYGINYVVLAGDVSIVPCRGFSVHAGSTIDDGIPSDLYYAGLDRVGTGSGPDWNVDNDGNWGEDGESDYYPELAIGRFSATTASEFQAIVNKQIMYQTSPVVADLDEAQMVGEQLNDSPLTWGGDYKDEVVAGGTYNGFTTVGFPSTINIYRKYEREGDWSASALATELNSGRNIVNHMGHSNTDYNMKFYLSDVTNTMFTANGLNHNYYFIYSQGCYAAAFDDNSIAEKFCNISNGCFAYLGNSRYGWYNPGGTDASSQYLDRQFFDAVFGENITRLGDANDDSKVDGVSQCSDDWFRWTYFELNLFGDPSADLWTATPVTFSPTYLHQIPVSQTSLTVQTGVAGALVGISRNNAHVASATAGANGIATVLFSVPFTETCTLDVTISAHNYTMHQGQIQVTAATGPYVTIASNTVHSGDDDVIGYGETGTIDITLTNAGTAAASSVSLSATSGSGYLTLTDATQTFGTIAAGANATQASALGFTVSNTVPNNTPITLTITITSGSDTWNGAIYLTAYRPVISLTNVAVLGIGNSNLDPGETANFVLTLSNTGGAKAAPVNVSLSESNASITVNSAQQTITQIAAAGTATATFSVTADSSIPIGTIVPFSVAITAASGYSTSTTFNHIIGLQQETFETGSFASFPWALGIYPWTIANTGVYAGIYSAKSGTITHNQSSELSLQATVNTAGTISFYYKVSSEASYDYLRFYIDGTPQDSWSGTTGSWEQVSYTVTTGSHAFKWAYSKDGSESVGSDCAWIDNIIFPPMTYVMPVPVFTLTPSSLDFGTVYTDASTSLSFTIGNTGTATMTGQITTPTGYIVAGAAREVNRNSLSYSIAAGSSQVFSLTFAPTAAQSYNGSVTITSNDASNPTNSLTVTGSGAINTSVTLLTQGFESTTIPTGWTQDYVSESTDWTFATGGYSSHPAAAHGGSYNARLYYTSTSGATTKLVTPVIDFGANAVNPTLTFWHAQALWSPDQDNLKVYYRTSASGTWNLLQTYTENLISWTQHTITLPDVNSTYYIAFEGIAKYGFGVCIDDVSITASLPVAEPALTLNPTSLAFGTIPVAETSVLSFTIGNTEGTASLTGNITAPTDFTVAVDSRTTPLTRNAARKDVVTPSKEGRNALDYSINAGGSQTFTLTFAPTTQTTYNTNLVITSNDEEFASVNLPLSGIGGAPLVPEINVLPDTLSARLDPDSQITQYLTIQNTGTANLTYSISVAPSCDRTTLLSETFDSSIPSTWSIVDGGSGGNAGYTTWFQTSAYNTNTLNGTGFAFCNSDACGSYLMDEQLISPTLECAGYSNLILQFDHYYLYYASSLSEIADADVWNGSEWVNVYRCTSTSVGAWSTPNHQTIDISAYANNHLQVRFHYYNAQFDWYWAVDNVTITGDLSNPAPYLTLGQNSGTIAPNGFSDIPVTFDTTDFDDGTYTACLTISNNDQDEGTVTVPVVLTVQAMENVPDWTPVTFPNSPATVYAAITVNGIPAEGGDLIGAFVGSECRATGSIVMNNGIARSTMEIQVSGTRNEEIRFKVYDRSEDVVYSTDTMVSVSPGYVVGSQEDPVTINATTQMATPTNILIRRTPGGVQISWDAVPNASTYYIYAAPLPTDTFQLIGSSTTTTYTDSDATGLPKRFYQVTTAE